MADTEKKPNVINFDVAIKYVETEMPNVEWELNNILNPHHAATPHGAGVSLLLVDHETSQRVWEKCNSDMLRTAQRAVARLRARNAGDTGA